MNMYFGKCHTVLQFIFQVEMNRPTFSEASLAVNRVVRHFLDSANLSKRQDLKKAFKYPVKRFGVSKKYR